MDSRRPACRTGTPSRIAVNTSCSDLAVRIVITHVVGRHQPDVMPPGQPGQPTETGAIVAPVEHVRGQVAWPGEAAAQGGQPGGEGLRARAGRGQDDEDLPLGMGAEVLQMEPAPALARALLPPASAGGKGGRRPPGRAGSTAGKGRPRDRGGRRPAGGSPPPWRPRGPARCRPASAGRRCRSPSAPVRPPVPPAPRDGSRPGGS